MTKRECPEEVVFRFYQGDSTTNPRKFLDAYRNLKDSLMEQAITTPTKREHISQALQFLDWFRRLPSSTTITDAFREWATSKSFSLNTEKSIVALMREPVDSTIDGPFDSKMSLAPDAIAEERQP